MIASRAPDILPIPIAGGSYDATNEQQFRALVEDRLRLVENSTPWADKLAQIIIVTDYGAVGDGAVDDTVAIQNAVTAAAGRKIYAPAGQYLVTSKITSSVPVHIYGDGNGAGPGPAAQSNSNVTQFLMGFSNDSLFEVTSIYPSVFRDFQVNVTPANRPGTSGAAIKLIGTGTSHAANAKIENVGFTNCHLPIHIVRPQYPTIRGCYFDSWVHSAVYLETSTGVEGSGGFISGNYFFGDTSAGTTQGPCVYSKVGYVVVSGNELLGGHSGVYIDIDQYDAGFVRVAGDNTIEEQRYYGVFAKTNGSYRMGMFDVRDNEFSKLSNVSDYVSSIVLAENGGSKWVVDVKVCGNTTRHSLSATAKHIWLQAGENVLVSSNILEDIGSSSPTGIQVTGATTHAALGSPFHVMDNTFKGSFTKRYDLTSNTLLRDSVGFTYAALPTACANGSTVFVTDGLSASSPLASGGTGCWASLQNGSWVSMAAPVAAVNTIDLVLEMDGGGSTLTTGVKGDVQCDFPFTIVQWTLLADQSGSIVVDLWKDTYANYPPTGADTITASAKPTISASTKGQSSTLTGWTTSVSSGDTIRLNIDSVSSLTRCVLVLKCTKTG